MSDIVGPEDPTRLMWEMSLGEFLDSVARRNPDKVFVEMEGEEVTYGRFRETARRARRRCFRGWESHPATGYACFCLIAWSSCIAGSDYPTWEPSAYP